MNNDFYLTGIPQENEKFGLCKTLLVRREVIDWKHIMTEIFVRKTIDIESMLSKIGLTLFDYMEYMTIKLRHIHHFTRDYKHEFGSLVKQRDNSIFQKLDLYSGLNVLLALDFDGTVTKSSFKPLYDLCLDRSNTVICTANPTVTADWFEKRGYAHPKDIHACNGKVSKIKKLMQLHLKHDIVFFVDNEEEYLRYAWIFGLKTFHFTDNKIKYFSLKTK